MIGARPSLEAAKGLAGTQLLNYLLTRGWSARPSRIDGISIVSKNVPGADGPAEFILPVEPGWEEEQRRVADALRTVSAIEGRPMRSIVDDARGLAGAGRAGDDHPSSVVGIFRDASGVTFTRPNLTLGQLRDLSTPRMAGERRLTPPGSGARSAPPGCAPRRPAPTPPARRRAPRPPSCPSFPPPC